LNKKIIHEILILRKHISLYAINMNLVYLIIKTPAENILLSFSLNVREPRRVPAQHAVSHGNSGAAWGHSPRQSPSYAHVRPASLPRPQHRRCTSE